MFVYQPIGFVLRRLRDLRVQIHSRKFAKFADETKPNSRIHNAPLAYLREGF